MKLSQKETDLLKDLKTQEELCIEKYKRYASDASDGCLKNLFSSIAQTEQSHLSTIQKIMKGEEVKVPAAPSAPTASDDCSDVELSEEEKQHDAYLCQDALAMEKHISSLYDVSIFEFTNPTLRDTLNSIQKEEQNHGKQIYDYMEANGLCDLAVS